MSKELEPVAAEVIDYHALAAQRTAELAVTNPELSAVQREYISKMYLWGANHCISEGHKANGLVGYAESGYTIEEPHGDIKEPWFFKVGPIYNHAVLPLARRQLGKNVGGTAVAHEMIEDVRSQTVDFAGGVPLLSFIEESAKSGLQTMVAVPHAEQDDVAVIAGALKTAYTNREMANKFLLFMNYVISLETMDGRPIMDQFDRFFKRALLSPNTANAAAYMFPPEVHGSVNRHAIGYVTDEFKEQGHVSIIAPFASGVTRVPISRAERRLHLPFTHEGAQSRRQAPTEKLVFPALPPTAAAMVARKADFLLPFSMYRDPRTRATRWQIGKLVDVKALTRGAKKTEADEITAHFLRIVLRKELASLTDGVPVELHPSEPEMAGKIAKLFRSKPHIFHGKDEEVEDYLYGM